MSKVCKFCGKINDINCINYINCHYSVFFEIKKEYNLDECCVCLENFSSKRKRYFDCCHFICDNCVLNDISTCPICRKGKIIEIEKFGYFNIIPKNLIKKIDHLTRYPHIDVLLT